MQILEHDSRVTALYNAELSILMQFIYIQLKIPLPRLLSMATINDNQEIAPPPFSTMYLEINRTDYNDSKKLTKLAVRRENQTSIIFNGFSDPRFVSYLAENNPDIIVFCGDHNLLSLPDASFFKERSRQKVIFYTINTMDDIHLLGLVEKACFSFLPLRLVSKYGMMRLIDSME
jgi:hypothetical protein